MCRGPREDARAAQDSGARRIRILLGFQCLLHAGAPPVKRRTEHRLRHRQHGGGGTTLSGRFASEAHVSHTWSPALTQLPSHMEDHHL